MIKIGILLAVMGWFIGCQLVTIQVHQRAIVDIGDNTDDDYTNHNTETDEEIDTTSVPVTYKTTIQAN